MVSTYVLLFQSEGDCTVTLHYDLEDAQAYRAWHIAELISSRTLEDGELTDLITAHLLQGDYVVAYECFMQWVDMTGADYHFDIRHQSELPPVSHSEISELLFDEDDFEVIDQSPKKEHSTPQGESVMTWTEALKQATQELPKATLDTKMDEMERLLACGYEEVADAKAFLDSDEDEASFSFGTDGRMIADKKGNFVFKTVGDRLAIVPKRIDGGHAKTTFSAMMDAMMDGVESLTEAVTSSNKVQEERAHPQVTHHVKGRKNGGKRGSNVPL